jgi:hypothetical protein
MSRGSTPLAPSLQEEGSYAVTWLHGHGDLSGPASLTGELSCYHIVLHLWWLPYSTSSRGELLCCHVAQTLVGSLGSASLRGGHPCCHLALCPWCLPWLRLSERRAPTQPCGSKPSMVVPLAFPPKRQAPVLPHGPVSVVDPLASPL